MPHLHDLAVISQGVDDDTGKLAKKSGDAPSNELLHNVHCYLEGDKKMVELHVDLLTVKERMRLYPWWGGGISKRVDLTKNLVEEYGQDEAAFHQNDERKNHWHQEGKVRLTQSEKQRGAVSHCAVVTNYRHGVGGNLVSDETWAAHELVRPEYDPALKNPFMIWCGRGSVGTMVTGEEQRLQCSSRRYNNFCDGRRNNLNLKSSSRHWGTRVHNACKPALVRIVPRHTC